MLGGAAFYGDSGASGRGLVRAIGRGSMARFIGAAAVDPIGGALRLVARRNGLHDGAPLAHWTEQREAVVALDAIDKLPCNNHN